MTDKYEDAAREFLGGGGLYSLSGAFRWYEQKYLTKKAEETCEWVWGPRFEGDTGAMKLARIGCGNSLSGILNPSRPITLCPYCGRRIVEAK